MKVSGFTFIRNAIRYDYPVVEAIRSILPLCDNFVVALGNSDDGTRELISSIDPTKIRIIDSIWDDTLREGGRVLALETDKAYRAIDSDCDWAFYIQGDEVVHEKYLDTIRESMLKWKDHRKLTDCFSTISTFMVLTITLAHRINGTVMRSGWYVKTTLSGPIATHRDSEREKTINSG